jgi:hypothetical protein
MSTRCRIGILNKDRTVESIYCHHDGYLIGGVGEMLYMHYNTEEKVRELLKQGDLNALAVDPKDCDTFQKHGEPAEQNRAVTHKDIKTFASYQSDAEYRYLFDTEVGDWYLINYETHPSYLLAKALDDEAEGDE